jgi:hypothetical protein
MNEDDWRGIGINFWLFMALWLFMVFYCSFLALYGFHGSLWLKSLKSLLDLTLLVIDAVGSESLSGIF